MKQYLEMLRHVLVQGTHRPDRTGTGTLGVFGYQTRFNLREGFPLITTKKVPFRLIVEELLWFLRGETNVRSLQQKNVHIWDEWADKDGELGPVYGSQWRFWVDPRKAAVAGDPPTASFGTVDQIRGVIDGIRKDPYGRRHIVTSWNPSDIPHMRLPPCHVLFQFYVNNGELSCQLYQRSADIFLGVPFNIASYALLTHMVAQVCGLRVGDFVHTFGDLHLYANHVKQAEAQLERDPLLLLPRLRLNPAVLDIDRFSAEDITLVGCNPHPAISAPVAV